MKAQTQRRLRQIHQYTGLFFAPAILFFAFSGMIQVIGVQDYKSPPAWVSWIANVHKHQQTERPQRRPRPPEAAKADAPKAVEKADADDHDHGKPFVPLKAFVLLLALGLMTSTVIGILIALQNAAMRRNSWIALGAGVAVPLLLMLV